MLGRRPEPARRRPEQGRTPAKTFSYYTSGSSDKKPEKVIDMSKSRGRLRMLPSWLAVAVISGSVLFSMTVSPKPQVEPVSGQTLVYHTADEYAEAAAELTSRHIGNSTKFTINTDGIEQAMLERFPELRSVSVRLPVLGRKPTLLVDIRSPELLLINSGQSLLLDSQGVAVAETRVVSSDVLKGLQVVQDQNAMDHELGKQVVTTDTVTFIKAVKAQLEAQGLKISRLTLPASANQLDVSVEGLTYFIKMDLSGDARLQTGSFLAVKDRGIVPTEYIDVRVEEKVFYK